MSHGGTGELGGRESGASEADGATSTGEWSGEGFCADAVAPQIALHAIPILPVPSTNDKYLRIRFMFCPFSICCKCVWLSGRHNHIQNLSGRALIFNRLSTLLRTEPGKQGQALRFDWSRNALMTQSTKVNFWLHEPEALADFLHVERTRLLSPRAHFCRLCLL
jgi:hypothetical protein